MPDMTSQGFFLDTELVLGPWYCVCNNKGDDNRGSDVYLFSTS